jgi:hypothetical protein
MNYEKEYIKYLIDNVDEIDTGLLDLYFLNEIDFTRLIEYINVTEHNVMSFNTFVKSKKIDNLFS